MHETIQMPSGLFYLIAHLVVDLHVEDIGDEIESILVVLNLRVKSGQIEAVRQIVLVDLAEVFVALRRDELCILVSLCCWAQLI